MYLYKQILFSILNIQIITYHKTLKLIYDTQECLSLYMLISNIMTTLD